MTKIASNSNGYGIKRLPARGTNRAFALIRLRSLSSITTGSRRAGVHVSTVLVHLSVSYRTNGSLATPYTIGIDRNAKREKDVGAGENVTVSAPANRAGNPYQASNSADSSAHSEFANALNQEKGSSQVHGGGTKTPTVDNQMMGILNNPHLSENAKVAELKKAIADLPDAEKKGLYERLKDRKSHDPLAQQFHYRLSHHPYKAGGVSTTTRVNGLLTGRFAVNCRHKNNGKIAA
jgi:hypothetical protein